MNNTSYIELGNSKDVREGISKKLMCIGTCFVKAYWEFFIFVLVGISLKMLISDLDSRNKHMKDIGTHADALQQFAVFAGNISIFILGILIISKTIKGFSVLGCDINSNINLIIDGTKDIVQSVKNGQTYQKLKPLTDKLNESVIFKDGSVNRLWKYIDIDKSSNNRLYFSIEYRVRFENSFNFRRIHNTKDNTNVAKSLEWYDDVEKEIILSEVEKIEKITPQAVQNTLNVIDEYDRLKNEKNHRNRVNEANNFYHVKTNERTSKLEKSLQDVRKKLEKMK